MFAPNSSLPGPTVDCEETVYRPMRDLEEGSGDSEDELFGANTSGSVGVTDDLEDVNLGTTFNPKHLPVQAALGRERGVELQIQGRRKKYPFTKEMADSIATLVSTTKDRSDAFQKVFPSDALIKEVVAELFAIEEVAMDKDFCARCCDVMLDPEYRAMFAAIKDHKDVLLRWLRKCAYATI